jgi:hypothetical protein
MNFLLDEDFGPSPLFSIHRPAGPISNLICGRASDYISGPKGCQEIRTSEDQSGSFFARYGQFPTEIDIT